MASSSTSTPPLSIQGVRAEDAQVDPTTFFKLTRRQRFQMAPAVSSFAGLGATDSVQLRQTGIIAAIDLRLQGTLTVTPGSGTVASTARWPYDLIRALRLSANGQTNLVNCSGAKLKARQIMSYPGFNDRGVPQGVGGASPGTTVYQGTLAMASESWGIGQSVSAIAGGNYAVDLTWRIPLAWDEVKLLGAIYAQTQSTSIDLAIDWQPLSSLFTFTSNATASLSAGWVAEGIVFTIPSSGGKAVVPDLSVFHTLVQSNLANAIGTTTNEIVLSGQGVGKQLMRIYGQLWQGASPSPLVLNETNWGNIGWRYGGNETPEVFTTGMDNRRLIEENYGSDLGGNSGFFVIDFAAHWAFRDSVDEGSASQLRLVLQPQVALTSPILEYCQEAIVAGSSSA